MAGRLTVRQSEKPRLPQTAATDAAQGVCGSAAVAAVPYRGTPHLLPQETPPKDATGALLELAHRVDRLCPSHRDPERFHEDKSDIAHALRRLARERR
jgi:hypothetical protein